MGLIQWNSPHGSLTLGQSGPGTFYFTVPFGVFLIFIQAYAGGGAGGSGYANTGDPNGGGGGGASGTTWASLQPEGSTSPLVDDKAHDRVRVLPTEQEH